MCASNLARYCKFSKFIKPIFFLLLLYNRSQLQTLCNNCHHLNCTREDVMKKFAYIAHSLMFYQSATYSTYLLNWHTSHVRKILNYPLSISLEADDAAATTSETRTLTTYRRNLFNKKKEKGISF